MRECYFDEETRAIADLISHGDLAGNLIITRINVPKEHRGKGIARKLLKEILFDADKDRVILHLEVSPSDGLNREQLVAWYKRHGFEDYGSGLMIRTPKRVFMLKKQEVAIYSVIINTLVHCEECNEIDGLLSIKLTQDGRFLCHQCAPRDALTVSQLVQNTREIESLHNAFTGGLEIDEA